MKRFFVMTLLILSLVAPGFAQRRAVFPQFASGGGWSSEYFFANQGISIVSGIRVDFFDNNGTPLSVDSNLGKASGYTFDLDAGATEVIKVTPGSDLVTGYALVTYPSFYSPVRGSQLFRYESGGIVSTKVGVPQQEQGEHFSFPVEVNSAQGILTSLAVVNPAAYNNTSETLIASLINPDGSIRAAATVPLKSGEHFAAYLHEAGMFPGLGNFMGSISISSPLGVGVQAFRQDLQAFGGITSDGGPIMGPFALSGTAIEEEEPNDYDLSAQFIRGSQIVKGKIGVPGDVDIFYFNGKKDHIISIICDTQGTDSSLDPVLGVFDRNHQQVGYLAYNDQNGLAPGLYPQGDSFIRMQLPADGIYYVMVFDFYESGGPGYAYTLHLNLP